MTGTGTGTGRGRSMVDAPRSSINIIRRSEKEKGAAVASLPSIVFDHVSQLDDELSLFVLLTALKRVLLEKTHKMKKKKKPNQSNQFCLHVLPIRTEEEDFPPGLELLARLCVKFAPAVLLCRPALHRRPAVLTISYRLSGFRSLFSFVVGLFHTCLSSFQTITRENLWKMA